MSPVLHQRLAIAAGGVWLGILLLATAVVSTAAGAAGLPRAPAKLRPVGIARLLETGRGPGPSYLRTDEKRRVYLLHAATLAVFRVSGGAVARRPERILAAGGQADFISDAAPCSGADSWVLLSLSAQRIRLFAGEKERLLPAPDWFVTGVACPGGIPVIAVAPGTIRPTNIAAPQEEQRRDPDLLYIWGDERWEPFLARPQAQKGERQSAREQLENSLAASQVVTATQRDGSLWVAQAHTYSVRRVSSSGRVLTSISDETSRIEMRSRTKAELEQLDAALRSSEGQRPENGFGPVPRRSVAGVAEGPDGMVYLLVEPMGEGGSLAIDRYNPVELKVERALLAVPSSTKIKSFVAGPDGLYFATPSVSHGAWWLPWDELDQGEWEPVQGLTIR